MPQITPKLLILGAICVFSVTALMVVAVQAMAPEEPTGLRAGTWTVVGQAESLSASSDPQAGVAQLGELESFDVEASSEESPVVNLTLRYRNGSAIAVVASSDMQPRYLQATLVGANGVQAFVSFKQKSSPSRVEVTDGLMLARFAQ